MAGRHGNKGVISKVVPMEDMPFLADGTPVDFVLNPLGVPSRMNVGQILETHMGWAARGLGIQIDEALDEYRRSGDMTPVRDALKIAYGEDTYQDAFGDKDEDEVLEAAGNVTRGVPIATPVFDGAKEADVNDALRRAGFDTSGQSDLFDGRTGEQFRAAGDGGCEIPAQAAPPGGRQDPRAFDRALTASSPAAAGRQGAVRRPAFRRDGGLGAGSLRRRLHLAGKC